MLSIVQKGGAYGIKRTLRGGLEPHEANAADSDVEAVRLSKKNPDIPVSQLPQVCCMQTSAISRLMKKMEADGLIVRKVDPNCRRNTLVSVTEAGAEQCRRNWEEIQDFWERVLARTPEEHIDQMLCLWDEIMGNMETVIDELSQDK